jgi:peptidoglycan/xylan/chitin deacetylase (PgdA/CDA1 family)
MYFKFSKISLLLGILVLIFLVFSCATESTGDTEDNIFTDTSSSSSLISSSSSSDVEQSSSSIAAYSSSSSFLARSSSSSEPISSSSSSLASSSSSNLTGKAAIDAEIDANWSRLGYSSKPTKVIALSFDDGPCPQTQSLLTALTKKEVKTTFFLIGQNITSNNAAARAIYEAGHELANHSDGYSANPNQQNVQSCSDKIKAITGSNPTLFRAPNVDYGNGAVDNVCKALNLPMIDVSCWSNDYNGISSTQIRNNVNSCAGDGKIVNLHEFNTATGNNAAGIEGLIDDLRSAGYWILPVGQMAVYKGITLEGGKKYFSF